MSSTKIELPNTSTTSDATISTLDRRYSLDAYCPSRVGTLRCSRCARYVEIILKGCMGDTPRRASTDNAIASANGMIRYHSCHIGLSTHLAIYTHILGYTLHLFRKFTQPINHVVYGLFKHQHLSCRFDLDLLTHITIGNSLCNCGDTSNL